jgi:hypothetical protein
MQIENHKEEVPFSYYEDLFKKIDPAEVVSRLSFVTWDGSTFALTLLGRAYRLSWPEYAIEVSDGGKLPPLPTQTFLLRVLLEGKDVAWMNEWKTFREMPWGEMYITPYTGRVLTRAAFTFGTRLAKFKAAAEKLGGIPVKNGDAGYEFQVVGPYRMRILVWEGDDEFPPNAQVLYPDNFASGFSAEDRVVSGDILIGHIKAAM